MNTLEYDQFDFLFFWGMVQERRDFLILKGQTQSHLFTNCDWLWTMDGNKIQS